MSNKRPLSPESTNGYINNDVCLSKRFKLHSIIQELRNEEANLVILKKLRSSQHIASKTNHPTQQTTSNGVHSAATRVPTINKSVPSIPTSIPSATRKPSVTSNPPTVNKSLHSIPNKMSDFSSTHSLDERKNQAKEALFQQLKRDLLHIPSPKPLLQDVHFVPNPNSIEFQPYIGLEDVVQCLYELQTDRQRLPQRFTDRARIDEPFVCDHCGTDFTIRWWKHLNSNHSLTNILCDRCKKKVTRQKLKSDHSDRLKKVFLSAMDQEKEIEKNFHISVKQQQKNAARSSSTSKSVTPQRPVPSTPIPQFHPNNNHHHLQQKTKTKSSMAQVQNFATKLSQQSMLSNNLPRKSNVLPQTINHSTNQMRTKTPMPAHQQQQYRSVSALPQQTKNLPMTKVSKHAARPASITPSIPPYLTGNFLPGTSSIPASSMNNRPTATKRRTLPPENQK